MSNDIETQFQKSGSLKPPLIMGLGVGCLHLVWQLSTSAQSIISAKELLQSSSMWFPLVLGLVLLPYIINIGFSLNTKRWSQIFIVIISIALIAFHWFVQKSFGGTAFNTFTLVWLLYVFSHLGISFVLSTLLGTPGCEMRAIPHAYTLITGKDTQEQHCPGFLHQLDEWERKKL